MKPSDVIRKTNAQAYDLLLGNYALLCAISARAPIGRRALADFTGETERAIRDALAPLTAGGLVSVCRAGVSLTDEGREALGELFTMFSPDGGPVIPRSRPALALAERSEAAARELFGRLTENDVLLTDDSDAVAYAARSSAGRQMPFGAEGTSSHTENKAFALLRARLLRHGTPMPPVLPTEPHELAAFIGTDEVRAYTGRVRNVTAVLCTLSTVAEAVKKRSMPHRLVNLLIDQGAVAELLGYYLACDGRIVYSSAPLAPEPEKLAAVPLYIVASEKCGERELAAVRCRYGESRIFF